MNMHTCGFHADLTIETRSSCPLSPLRWTVPPWVHRPRLLPDRVVLPASLCDNGYGARFDCDHEKDRHAGRTDFEHSGLMMKRAIRVALAGAVCYTGLLSLIRRSPYRRSSAIILMYHRVLPAQPDDSPQGDWERVRSLPGIVVTPEMFDAQLSFLARHYNVISLARLLQHLNSGNSLPARTVAITFDDGWRDNYTYAFPLLKKHNLPATVFLTANYVGTLNVFWPELVIWYLSGIEDLLALTAPDPMFDAASRFSTLFRSVMAASGPKRLDLLEQLINRMKELAPETRAAILAGLEALYSRSGRTRNSVRVVLDWNEIAEMQTGGISFGSHGTTHELLTLIDRRHREEELVSSRMLLESQLGTVIDMLAYPNGAFDDEVKLLAARCGYSCAVSVRRARVSYASDRYALGRINIHQGCCRGILGCFSPALFACHIEGFPT